MKKNKKIKLTGFTLVEIMVVISILAIMTLVSFASLSSSKKNVALRSAQREVASAIRIAQSYALQGKWPSGAASVCGYGFRFETTSQYRIFYFSKTGGVCDINNQTISESQALQGGVVLSSPNNSLSTTTRVYFNIPNGNANIPGCPGPGLMLAFNASGTTKTVTINCRGSVTEN
jgi:prepilin-type N-terminal cleavage/methylation domain-containing protein